MQKAVKFFSGSVEIEVVCPYPERFLNLCAQNGVDFWDMRRVDENTVRMKMGIDGAKTAERLSSRNGYEIKTVQKSGVPFFLGKIRKRYALITGMFVCVFAVWFSSFFVWEIDVSGNENLSKAEILNELRQLNVDIGTCRLLVDQDYISNEMLQRLPELCWIAVNVKGSHADVLVREATPIPEMIDNDTPTLVYAEKSGIITKIITYNGNAKCAVGDTVLQGDTLVTGVMESKSSGTRFVHAMAKVYARTWYTMSAQMPLNMYEKAYTGESKTKTALIIGGKRVNLYIDSGISWQSYDKITEEKPLTVFGDTVLPLKIVKDTYTRYEEKESAITKEEAEKMLSERLTEKIRSSMNDGEIISCEFESVEENGIVTVTVNAECNEQIAVMRDLSEGEITAAENAANEEAS